MTDKTVRMWAVKRPDGKIMRDTVQRVSFDAKLEAQEQKARIGEYFAPWNRLQKDGYRCVRVRVTEETEG